MNKALIASLGLSLLASNALAKTEVDPEKVTVVDAEEIEKQNETDVTNKDEKKTFYGVVRFGFGATNFQIKEFKVDETAGAGGFEAGVGYYINKNLRAEVLLNSTAVAYDDSYSTLLGEFYGDTDITTSGIVAQVIYDFNVGKNVTPFVGLGIGYSEVEYEFDGYFADLPGIREKEKLSDDVSSFSLLGGVGFNVSKNLDFDVQLKITGFGDAKVSKVKMETVNSTLFAGLRYNF